jgi:hypothetical protein
MEKNYRYLHTRKRTFSSTSLLSADNGLLAKIEALRASLEAKNTVAKEENSKLEKAKEENSKLEKAESETKADKDLVAKIEALRANLEAKNTVAKEENSKLEKAESEVQSIHDKFSALTIKGENEKQSMYTYIDHFGAFMKQDAKEKADKILSDSKKIEELFNKKISNEEDKEISLLKQMKLQSTKEKLIHEAEDKVESMINKSVEKSISSKELDIPFQRSYLMARALRLKERKEFKEEEKQFYSESTSRLSPIDHVVEQMDCTEPDYNSGEE